MSALRSTLLILPLLLVGCDDDGPLPELGALPELSLTDQAGETFTRADLTGKVSIVDFVFTRCPTICPLLSRTMSDYQERFADADDVQLVSISVDPEHDTPEVLQAYGERWGADHDRWRLVTGPSREVNRVVVQGFKVAMGQRVLLDGEGYDIMHSNHFVLVDRNAQIRGYYDNDEEGGEELVRDVERLRATR